MADKIQNRIANPVPVAEDDPFAELTRIMGFDPREPAGGPGAPVQQPAPPVAAQVEEPDLGIDLERELMGEFEDFRQDALAEQPLDEMPAPMDAAWEDDLAASEPRNVEPRVDTYRRADPEPQAYDLSEEAYGDIDAEPVAEAMPQATPAPQDWQTDIAADQPTMDMDQWSAEDVRPAAAAHGFESALDLPRIPLGHARTEGTPQLAPDEALDLSLERELDTLFAEPAAEDELPAEHGDAGYGSQPFDDEPAPALAATTTADRRYTTDSRMDAPRAAAEPVEARQPATPAWAAPGTPVSHAAAQDRWSDAAQHAPRAAAEPVEARRPATPAWAAPSAPVSYAATQDRWSDAAQDTDETIDDDDFALAFDEQAFETALSNGMNSGRAADQGVAAAPMTETRTDTVMPRDGHDPYAALAALSADLRSTPSWQATETPRQPNGAAHARAYPAADAPDIDTVDVPEQAVALADDLELPDFTFEDEPAAASSYDDIDAEFASLLNEMNAVDHAPAAVQGSDGWDARQPTARYDDPALTRPIVAGAVAGAAIASDAGRRYAVDPGYDDPRGDFGRGPEADMADMEFAYDPDAEEEIPAAAAYAARRPSRGRGLTIAAVVAGVALLGGAAAFMVSFGDGAGSGEVALVKADPAPTKVRPENPGGALIPNQDNKVYDSVAGAGAVAAPTQEKLLQSAEEPVEIPLPQDDGDLADADGLPFPGDEQGAAESDSPMMADGSIPKAEDRVAQTEADAGVDDSVEVAAVPPRKVRTMIVKADGTLVAREEPAAEPETSADAVSDGLVDPIASATTEPADAATADPVPSDTAPQAAASEAAKKPAGATPKAAPIAPARPSEQPVDIVGEVKGTQVAALAPTAAPAAGAWSMQIASQPSEAAAQSSYKDLLRRYSGVLSGHQAAIVKAEIAGKGTYWRVRVPAGSRNEAVKLCESYKGAGGSCFVSK